MRPFSKTDLEQLLAGFAAKRHGTGSWASQPFVPAPNPPSRLSQMLSAPTTKDIADLEDALSHISPDVLRGNGSIIGADGQPEPGYWFGCLLAARREYGDAAKEVMRR